MARRGGNKPNGAKRPPPPPNKGGGSRRSSQAKKRKDDDEVEAEEKDASRLLLGDSTQQRKNVAAAASTRKGATTSKKATTKKVPSGNPSLTVGRGKDDRTTKSSTGAKDAVHSSSSSSSSSSEASSSSDDESEVEEGTSNRNTAEKKSRQHPSQAKQGKHDDSSEEEEEESSSAEEDTHGEEGSDQDGTDRDDDDDDESGNEQGDGDSDDDDGSEDDDDEEEEATDMPAFSDQNSSWLKPKKSQKKSSLLESDDDDEDDDDEGSRDDDDDDDEDDDNLLEVEREARLMDQEREEELMEADDEMRHTIRHHTSVYHLPTQHELDRNVDRVVPPSELKSHIESILEVLTEFRDRREPGRSRKEYLDVLGTFLAELHGYLPELIQYYLTMLGPAETVEFVAQSDKPRPLVIRTNTLKTRRKDLAAALMKRGVTLDPLAPWSKVGLVITESPVPIGATPEYLSGHYMLQSAASMCAVVALSPQPNDKVLDVSSAPGGKTTYLSQLMRNTGVVVANDLKSERQKATVANVHRLGVRNVVACQHDGRKLGTLFHNRFDRVLLDAPCSGLGVASRDPSVKVQRTLVDVHKCAHLQKELLLSAIDALKFKGTLGGVMVYSTCSVSVAENEEVVQYALTKRDIKIIDTGLDVGRSGFTRFQEKRFHPSMALTRRFYPHVHNMDGFFVAKIQKLSDGRPGINTSAEGGEVAVDDAVEDEGDASVEETDSKVQPVPKTDASKVKKKHRKRKGTDKAEAEMPKKAKNPVVSVPPPKPKAGKPKKQNAKVSKPRRSRAATDA